MELTYSENFIIYSRYIRDFRGTGTYKSPMRKEGIASFAIDCDRGLWYDFGLGKGGDVIELIKACDALTYAEAMNLIPMILQGVSGHYEAIRGILDNERATTTKSGMPDKGDLEFVSLSAEMRIYLSSRLVDSVKGYEHRAVQFFGEEWLYFDYGGDKYKLMRWNDGKKVLIGGGSLDLWDPFGYLQKQVDDLSTLVICEGEMDCLSALACGISAVSIPLGAGTFKPSWWWKIHEAGYKKVLLAYDNDEAGRKGMGKALEAKPYHIGGQIETSIIRWESNEKDLNEYFMRHNNLDFIRAIKQ